jgi:hypothetical protein
MGIRLRIDQLRGDAHAIARAADASLEDRADPESLRDRRISMSLPLNANDDVREKPATSAAW